jgi:hypothetical protein
MFKVTGQVVLNKFKYVRTSLRVFQLPSYVHVILTNIKKNRITYKQKTQQTVYALYHNLALLSDHSRTNSIYSAR